MGLGGRDPRYVAAELRLSEALTETRKRYADACAAVDRVRGDFTAGMPAPDGTFALSRAMAAREQAFHAYKRALREFTELIVHGNIPDDLA